MDNESILNTKNLTTEQKGEFACSLRGKGCNCCQAVIMAFKDELNMSEQDIKKTGAAFGGGCLRRGRRQVDGAVGEGRHDGRRRRVG